MKTPEKIAQKILNELDLGKGLREGKKKTTHALTHALQSGWIDGETVMNMIVSAVQLDRQQRGLEILHQRDPDYSCTLTVFVGGEPIDSYNYEDIDPGAGYEREDWDARAELPDSYSPAFRAATLEALDQTSDSPYISEDYEQ